MYLPEKLDSFLLARDAANSTNTGLPVIRPWPVSGKYGAGTRVAYYVLITITMSLHRAKRLREAALAAVLVLPTTAAIHGIVLAIVHVEGAVDLDVFGAFRIGAIGALARPPRLTGRTGLSAAGNSLSFLLNGIMPVGLFSLALEFIRASSVHCADDNGGNLLSSDPVDFPYGHATCGLICTTESGPFSAIRGGSNNTINVVPAPHKLSFNICVLISVACCFNDFMPMLADVLKTIERVWRRLPANRVQPDDAVDVSVIGMTAKWVVAETELLLLGILSSLAIVIVGEENFFSPQILYQTEPIATIGQWGPVVGVGLGIISPLYIALSSQPSIGNTKDLNPSIEPSSERVLKPVNCFLRTSEVPSTRSKHSRQRGHSL